VSHKTRREAVPVALILLLSIGLAGCHTTAGIGQDLEAAGSAIEREAEEAKSY
jgi:entericidin B